MPGYVENHRMQARLHQPSTSQGTIGPRPVPEESAPGTGPASTGHGALPTNAAPNLGHPLSELPGPGEGTYASLLAEPRENLPAHVTAAGGRIIAGPEDFNAYEKVRVEQADKGLKLAKIAIGAAAAVGVTSVVLAGLNFGSKNPPPPQPIQ